MQISERWYEQFFREDYYRLYRGQRSVGPDRTDQQVAFLEQALALPQEAAILDLACGWGRHAIPLAQRGYRITGQDLSQFHLDLARKAAAAGGVSLSLIHGDMREIPFEAEFDAVINIFSAFGYLENDAEDAKVLTQVGKALKPGGKFFIDLGNREHVIRTYEFRDWQQLEDGGLVLFERQMDLLESRNHVRITLIDPDGTRRETGHVFRFYTLTELVKILADAGLVFQRAWGDFDGSDYGLDSRRMIVQAQKL